MSTVLVHELADLAALERTAARLGSALKPGDVVLLEGPIGVGKTHFVRACVAKLGSSDTVASPTYTLMHVYETRSGIVLHLDAYRLSGVEEYLDLGIEDLLRDAIIMVEWGDRVAGAHPEHLRVVLELVPSRDTVRRCTIRGCGRPWLLPESR